MTMMTDRDFLTMLSQMGVPISDESIEHAANRKPCPGCVEPCDQCDYDALD